MGVCRKFRRAGKPKKKAPSIKEKVTKMPSHGEKKHPIMRRKAAKRLPFKEKRNKKNNI